MTYKDKNCLKCGLEYSPNNSTQKFCASCGVINEKEWREKNKEKRNENLKKYRKNNPEKIKKQSKKYRKNNPKKIKESKVKNRFKLTLNEYLKITKECSICVIDKSINCHHIIPKSKGGGNKSKNYIGLCFNCHHFVHKGMSIDEIKEYYKRIGIPLQTDQKLRINRLKC